MFDNLLKTIFNKTVNESNSSTKNETVNDSNNNTKNESKSDNESVNESDHESDNERDDESKKDKYYYEIRQLNNWFETTDQTKSLEGQIEILKTKDLKIKFLENINLIKL